jgi:hypothetical protein
MKNVNFKTKHVPWAQTMCLASFGLVTHLFLNPCVRGPSLVFVWPALAVVGRRWLSVAFVWPVGAKMGGLDVVGVKMGGWGVETRGWELKHVVEGWQVHYREKTRKIKEKTRKIQKKTHLWPKQRIWCRLGSLLLLPPPKTFLCF